MSQTNYTPISLYYSATASNVPVNTNLVAGELAINTNDGKLFYKDSSGVVQVLATKATTAGTFTTVTTGTLTSPAATALTIQSAGTTAMTVDTSQNVGIGTASPTTYGQFAVVGNSTGNLYQGNFANINAGSNTTKTVSTAFYLADTGATLKRVASILAYPDGVNVLTGGVTFNVRKSDTDVSEAMRIDSSGNLLVGTTSALSGNTFKANSGAAATFSTATSTNFSLVYFNNGTYCGSITTNGSATAFNTSSDYRLKENVQPMTGALTKIALLKPVVYKWKINGADGEGFIAHELAEIFPDAVAGEKDAIDEDGNIKPQGIDTSFLVATLTAAIQEQQALIESLTTRLTALESK